MPRVFWCFLVLFVRTTCPEDGQCGAAVCRSCLPAPDPCPCWRLLWLSGEGGRALAVCWLACACGPAVLTRVDICRECATHVCSMPRERVPNT